MNILTFDIEDWYNHDDYSQDLDWEKYEVRIYEGVDKILSALEEHQLQATFFCLGWVAEHHPGIIREIARAGHHVGCHSYQHQLASRMTEAEFREDIYKAKCLIEDVSGAKVDAFRVPSFSVTPNNRWVFDVLAELGFEYDSSVFPSQHEFGGFPELDIDGPFLIKTSTGFLLKEFPINTVKLWGRNIVYSGGGYFRIMPYGLLKKWTEKSPYVMSYFHPSDFDPEQPKMPHLPRMRQIKNRIALRGSYDKFKKFIGEFGFVNIRQADKETDWASKKTLDSTSL